MKYVIAGILIAIVVIGVVAYYLYPKPAQQLQTVTYATDFLIAGSGAGVFVANDKGWYEQNGIRLNIYKGVGSLPNVGDVDSGRLTFAQVHVSTALQGIASGAKIVIIGIQGDKNPVGMCAWKERNINTPKDLEGKTFASTQGSPEYLMLPLFFKINGADFSKFKLIFMSADQYLPTYLTGKTELVDCWRESFAETAIVLAQKQIGKDTTWIGLGNFGMDMYGRVWIASQKTIQTNPQLVKAFMAQTLRGYAYAMQNVDEATDAILRYEPTLNRDVVKLSIQHQLEDMITPMTKAHGLGWIDSAKLETTWKLTQQTFNITATINLSTAYTNDFLPGIMPPS